MTAAPHPFLDRPFPVAIAHRGGAAEAEENTLPAFAHAVALGYDDVELDVHATADGVVVIHHDPTLQRLCADPRAIADLSWPELRALRTRGGAQVPRLEDLLDAHPDLRMVIELKSDAVVAPLGDLLAQRPGLLDRVCVGGFDPKRTAALVERFGARLCWSPAHAGVARLWLAGWGLPLGAGGFAVVQVPPRFRAIPVVTPRFVRAARARGIAVQVWTVDDAMQMRHFLDIGVHGLITDRPTRLREVLKARGEWRHR